MEQPEFDPRKDPKGYIILALIVMMGNGLTTAGTSFFTSTPAETATKVLEKIELLEKTLLLNSSSIQSLKRLEDEGFPQHVEKLQKAIDELNKRGPRIDYLEMRDEQLDRRILDLDRKIERYHP